MHLSMHNWMRAEPLETTVARLAKFGYESIEISGEPEIYDTTEVRALLERYDIRCWGSVSLMFENRNLVSGDEAVRANSVTYVKDCITMVKELGGEEMTIVPATVGKITPDATPDEEWQWAVDGMKEIYEHALAAGVRPAIEPLNRFETYFINRGAQAMALAEATGPDCGVCLDAFVAPIDRTPANPYPNALETNFVDMSEEQRKFIEDHGSSTLTEEFYDWLVQQSAEHLLPLIR